MSFQEKSAWICLIISVAVFGPYFVSVFAPLLRGEGAQLAFDQVLGGFVGAVVLQVLLTIFFHIALALHDRNDRPDERDRAISARSFRVAC